MLGTTPADILADIAAGIFLAILGAVGVWLKRHLRGFSRMIKDWNGEPAREGISDGTPGVMQRLYRLNQYQEEQDGKFEEVFHRLGKQDEQLAKIDHEVHPNSGMSIKDSVNRIDSAVEELQEDVKSIQRKLDRD